MSEQNVADQVRIPSLVFCAVAPAFVILRFWSRIKWTRALGADDWTILAAVISAFTINVLMIEASSFQIIQPRDLRVALKLFWVAQIFYQIAIALTKASILFHYLRLLVHGRDRMLAWILIAIILTYGVAACCVSILQCMPVQKGWISSVPGHCINVRTSWYADAGFSILSDIFILILSLPMVYRPSMCVRQKIGLLVVFSIGAFVIITTILRITTLKGSSARVDTTYQIPSSIWSVIEVNVGIICACMPLLNAPLAALFPRLFSSTLTPTSSVTSSSHDNASHYKFVNANRNWARLRKHEQMPTFEMMSTVSVVDCGKLTEELVTSKDTIKGKDIIVKTTDVSLEFDKDNTTSSQSVDERGCVVEVEPLDQGV